MKYRIGMMGWKLAALLGLPLTLVVEIMHDDDAGVFVARCPDVRGLVAEADTLDALAAEVHTSLVDLMESMHYHNLPTDAEYRLQSTSHTFA